MAVEHPPLPEYDRDRRHDARVMQSYMNVAGKLPEQPGQPSQEQLQQIAHEAVQVINAPAQQQDLEALRQQIEQTRIRMREEREQAMARHREQDRSWDRER